MRLHRFYFDELIGDRTELVIKSAELINQIRNVFRMNIGDKLVIFDGLGSDYEFTIDSFNGESIISTESSGSTHGSMLILKLATQMRSAFIPARKIFLFAAIVKKDNFEWIVEKATELGVTDIIPVMAERSEKKSLNESRLKKIAVEASEQSGRGDVPKIWEIMKLEEAVGFARGLTSAKTIVFHTEGEVLSRSDLGIPRSDLGVFIGPEGGWSPRELEMFHKDNLLIRSLGPQVLRAETAVIATLSQVVFDIK